MADLTSRPVTTLPIDPITGQVDLQAVVNALAAQYASQYGGNPSAMSAAPVPAAPPSFARGPVGAVASQTIQPTSSMGVIKTANPPAGSVALPANVRPSSVGPDPGFDPLDWVKGTVQYDPFTGQTRMSAQQAMELAATRAPSPPVEKNQFRLPTSSPVVAANDGLPRLSPLDGINRLAPSPQGLPALYGTIPTALAYGQEPVPLPRPRPSTPALPTPRVAPKTVTYAGMAQPPSLIPPLQKGALDQLTKVNQMAQTPIGRVLLRLGAGFGSLGGSSAPAAPSWFDTVTGRAPSDGSTFGGGGMGGGVPGAFSS